MSKRLTDQQRALLFLYVLQVGVPPWAEGKDGTVTLLARAMNWTKERAKVALETNVEQGLVGRVADPVDPLDASVIGEI